MKKLLVLSVTSLALLGGTAAWAADVTVALGDGYNDVLAAADVKNSAQTIELTAIADRDGFIKNDFEVTLSANVALGLVDDSGNRVAVVSGSNRGRAVFTGSSDGGSVTQCGALVTKDTENLAASAVAADSLDLDLANACAR